MGNGSSRVLVSDTFEYTTTDNSTLTSLTLKDSTNGNIRMISSNNGTAIMSGNISTIPEYTFRNNSVLKSIRFPNSLTTVGNSAFEKCINLQEIDLGTGVVSLGAYCFGDCMSLSNISLPSTLINYGNYCFSGCSSLTTLEIDGSPSFGTYCFNGCTGLKTVIFNTGATLITGYTFKNCESLESITLPDTLRDISDFAFQGCSSLTEITLPSSIENIYRAFTPCPALTDVYVLATTPPYVYYNADYGQAFPDGVTIHVPSSALSAYQADDKWSHWTIVAI